MIPRSSAGGKSIIRAGTAVVAGNCVVQLANLGRDVAVAAAFGSNLSVDCFFLATMIPIFLMTVGTGAYRTAIVPIFERLTQSQGSNALRSVVARLTTVNITALIF